MAAIFRKNEQNGQTDRQGKLRSTRLLGLSIVAVIGIFSGVLAFAHSAAQIGLSLPVFKALGPSFYGWRPDQIKIEMAYQRTPANLNTSRLAGQGKWLLGANPLQTEGYRLIGWANAAQGNLPGARKAMIAAHSLSRRDTQVQLWLLQDSARSSDVPKLVGYFDQLLRTSRGAREFMLDRYVSVLLRPDARSAMRPILTPDTPWLGEMLVAAARRPDTSVAATQLLLNMETLPDEPRTRAVYGETLGNLRVAGRFDLIQQLHQRLPGANPATATSVGIDHEQIRTGYVPLVWQLRSEGDWGSMLVDSTDGAPAGIEAYAQPLTRGMAAEKLVFLRPGYRQFQWTIARMASNANAEATWRIECMVGGSASSVVTSANLYALTAGNSYSMKLPDNCSVLYIGLNMAGGTGSTSPYITVQNLKII